MRFRKLGRNCCPGNVGSASTIASLTEDGGLAFTPVPASTLKISM